jgi:hypothetical protein
MFVFCWFVSQTYAVEFVILLFFNADLHFVNFDLHQPVQAPANLLSGPDSNLAVPFVSLFHSKNHHLNFTFVWVVPANNR